MDQDEEDKIFYLEISLKRRNNQNEETKNQDETTESSSNHISEACKNKLRVFYEENKERELKTTKNKDNFRNSLKTFICNLPWTIFQESKQYKSYSKIIKNSNKEKQVKIS